MKLSMWTLYDYLIKDGFETEAFLGDGLPCINFFIESSGRSFSPEYADVFQNGKDVTVAYDMEQLIIKKASCSDVVNSLNAAVNYYTQWEHDLYECMLLKGTLQDLIEIAAEVFDRPMFIKNDASRTLAITKGYSETVHPYWKQIEESMINGRPDYDLVRSVSQDPDYRVTFMERYPSVKASPAYKAMVLHANIFDGDRRVAEIVTLENGKPFNNGDVHLMNTFADHVSKYVRNNTKIFQSGSDVTRFFKILLQNGSIETDQYKSLARYIGKKSEDEMCLIVASGVGQVDSPILSTLREKLESVVKNALVIQQEAQIIILQVLKETSIDNTVSLFARNIPKESFKWACSFEFARLEDIPAHYIQTRNILEKAGFDKENYVTMYEQEPNIIAEACKGIEGRVALVHPDILKLEQVDKSENTDYLESLFFYLLCGGNYTDASAIMSLHRNTLIYRMNKIREIMRSNPDDVKTRRILLSSYFMLDETF